MKTPTFIESYQTEEYDFCDRVVARLEEYISSQDDPAVAMHFMNGSQTNSGESNRRDYSFNFTAMQDTYVSEMHEMLRQYIPKYSETYNGFGMQACMSESMKVQKTPPKGGFHTWHAEHGRGDSASWRNLTIEYGMKIQPKKGLLCFFPAAWTHTHRGNPVYSCDKYIATGWYYLV